MQTIEPPSREPLLEDGELSRSWQNWFYLLSSYMPIISRYEQALEITSVAANTTAEQTFTVTGLTTRDFVWVNKPSHSTGLGVANARVSAANTLALTLMNTTGSAIDPSSETYFILAVRF